MTVTTTPWTAPIADVTVPHPYDPQFGMPLYEGPWQAAGNALKDGRYDVIAHNADDTVEGPAVLVVRQGRAHVAWSFRALPGAVEVRALIEAELLEINTLRGSTAWDDKRKISFGYIGNVYGNGDDDRSWSVFLPHPGRCGTYDDRIGSVQSTDASGFALLLAWVMQHREELVAYEAA